MGNRFCDNDLSFLKIKPKPKSLLTLDQKRLHWEAYAKKTERQEEVFKKVFNDVFGKQSREISDYYRTNSRLPDYLKDEETAKRFEAAIELVYHDAFESAV